VPAAAMRVGGAPERDNLAAAVRGGGANCDRRPENDEMKKRTVQSSLSMVRCEGHATSGIEARARIALA